MLCKFPISNRVLKLPNNRKEQQCRQYKYNITLWCVPVIIVLVSTQQYIPISAFYYVVLTVRLSIILAIDQINAQNLVL